MIHIITTGARMLPPIVFVVNRNVHWYSLAQIHPVWTFSAPCHMISPLNDCACALSRIRPQLGDLHPTSFSHGSFPVSPIHDIPIHFCRSALTMINSALDIKRLISSHSCQPGTKRNETEPDKSEVWAFDFRAFVKPNRDKNPNRKGKLECNSFPQCTYRTIRKSCLRFCNCRYMASCCSCCSRCYFATFY